MTTTPSSSEREHRRTTLPRRVVPAALVDVCMSRPPRLPAHPSTRRLFVDAVRHHRVAPLAHVMLRDSDPELAGELKPDRDTAMTRHITATATLDGLGQILDGLRWVTFKGPYLSEHAHPAPGLRPYHDIDVLVSPSELRAVAHRLADAGWTVADFRDMLRNTDVPGEMHWISPAGMLIDLHWSMINMAPLRRLFHVPTDELLERRRQTAIGLSQAWTLEPSDALTHVGLHAALTGAHRMLLILDVDQLARHVTDWDDVVARAHSWAAGPALAIVLARARALLGTPLPDDLEDRLGVSAGLRLVTRTVDHLLPVARLRNEASLPRLVARSARSSSGRTLAAVGGRGLRGVTERLGAKRRGITAEDREPADADALETYLRAVETYAGAVT